ncbi:MAG: hypothetical protein HPY54_12900 [Chthonomonadetes bacterium]|nr:hypothetical protein [Chthonomonadetes bacterium]
MDQTQDSIFLQKQHLSTSSRFYTTIQPALPEIAPLLGGYASAISESDLSNLLLSACRANDLGIVQQSGRRRFTTLSSLKQWVTSRLLPCTVMVHLDDPDVLRLLVFSIEMTEQMFLGGTRATISAKGFRERQRRYEEILVEHFIGRLGEVLLKKFLETHFPGVQVELDWNISPERHLYRSDIVNASHQISIKTTTALAGIWAEADISAEYGVMVKCIVPRATIIQFFIEACGYSRLMDFVASHIPASDARFHDLIANIRQRIQQFQCGHAVSTFVGFVLGYFKTSNDTLREIGEELEYMGPVRDKRHFCEVKNLLWERHDWERFLVDNGLWK